MVESVYKTLKWHYQCHSQVTFPFPNFSVLCGQNSLGNMNLDLLLVLSQVLDLLEDACESLLDSITAQS